MKKKLDALQLKYENQSINHYSFSFLASIPSLTHLNSRVASSSEDYYSSIQYEPRKSIKNLDTISTDQYDIDPFLFG